MKKNGIIILVGMLTVGVLFSSCKKPKIEVDFNMEVADIYFSIDPTTQTGDLDLATTTFDTELQKKLDENKASIDDVQSISINGVELIMINPGNQNFDILEKAYTYLSVPGLSETRIAYKESVPDGVTAITLDTDAANLKDYLRKNEITFRVAGFTSAPNTVRDSLQARLTFKIKAEVSK